jgi:tripartite-type tricarboxylate transporter receptor subunit TctC
MPHRRSLLALAAALPVAARAQNVPSGAPRWAPDRPVRAIVPFSPGGTTDVVARVMAEHASALLGQPVVVENRPGGAGGLVGVDAVAKSTPDGHTILIHSNAHAIAPALVARLPYDPIGDFAGVFHLGRIPQVLVVNPRLEVRDLAGLVAKLRAEPGRHHFASAGIGSAVHVAGEVFRAATRADIQPVHYRGGGPAMQAVITGEAIFTVDPIPSALGQIRGGSVRALAIAGPQRVASLPEVPTAAEAGQPDFRAEAWLVALAPARTPPAAVAALQAAFAGAQQRAAARLAELGVQPAPEIGTSAQIMAWLQEEMRSGVALLRAAGVQPE